MANIKLDEAYFTNYDLSHNLKSFFNDLADQEIQSINGGQVNVPVPAPNAGTVVPVPAPNAGTVVPVPAPNAGTVVPVPAPNAGTVVPVI
ncbi:hypothetical protein [Nostoc sp. LEGE 12450]|uniref:hypothetical protein n=1 Tax=Nostoc sp. LEGE 12450 TaxID=1828643 RepID=UPI00187EC323|nr:hypothetical protein [Nostoc sp. LEGE 12450]MBE8990356.1 hypothetical protein [Nostoc sp. LEGE 12450]